MLLNAANLVDTPRAVLPNDYHGLRIGESITVAISKGTVPFSSDENWDSPPVIDSPPLTTTMGDRDYFPSVTPFHASVRKGEAGKPSLFAKLGVASSRQANRTATGPLTWLPWTTIDLPSISAVAG
jgi:hypothetical protein